MDFLGKTEADRLNLRHLAELFFDTKNAPDRIFCKEDDATVSVSMETESKKTTITENRNLLIHWNKDRAKSAALGKAFAKAASHFTDYIPPYGTLFGVRPVKVPLFYLEKGCSEEKTKNILMEEYFVSREKAQLLTSLAKKEMAFASTLHREDAMLYVSIPFCPSRCNYCSFISSSAPSHLSQIPAYLDLLLEEMKKTAELFKQKEKNLRAVYIGGGTPGILSETQTERLLQAIRHHFPMDRTEEFCVEIGRPDTVTEEKLSVLKDFGVQRISINPQTVHDKTLNRIGRRHSAEDYFRAMEWAKKFAFSSVNCDLIAGLQGETADEFLQSVERVLALQPENLTIHALCQKRAAEKQDLSQGNAFREAMQSAHKACEEAGLAPYYLYRQKNAAADLENLGFAKSGKDCIYNVAMMEDLCDIFSVGAGGISKFIPKEKGGKISRVAAYKYPYEYLSDPSRIDKNLMKLWEMP